MPANSDAIFSISPQGEKFTIPLENDFKSEFKRIRALADNARSQQKEVVVVTGSDFWDSAIASIIADTKNCHGDYSKFVIWCQNSGLHNYWKIPVFNKGISPFSSENFLISELISSKVNFSQNLTATFNFECLSLADCVLVGSQNGRKAENAPANQTDIEDLKNVMKIIGEKISPYCLVLIDFAVVPGTTELIAYPILKDGFNVREIETEPLLAHCFKRVTPENHSLINTRNLWRVCAGCNDESRRRVRFFLKSMLETNNHTLTVLDRPIESETTSIVYNSYQAAIHTFFREWSPFAERNGVDLSKVIDAIKLYPLHSNAIFPHYK
ncbi:MAG TPA: hypothetical protein VHP36_02880 [Chitinispirillaceae bacterium]|nr:hypothetical protein [Chitinispirillaceae bacterium]